MNKGKVVILVFFTFFVVVNYQNCSTPSNIVKNAATATASPTVPIVPLPIPTPGPIPTCQPNYVYDGESCVPQTVACQSYQELILSNSPLVIPARDKNQVCYFVHVINQVVSASGGSIASSNWLSARQDIVARSHDLNHANAAPKVIDSVFDGSAIAVGAVGELKFTLQGQRNVMMGGNSAGNIPMSVDNFLFLEINSATKGKEYVAEGSSDSVPFANPNNSSDSSTGPITINGQAVPFVSFGTSGTVQVAPVDISNYLPINDQIDFKVTGLDCGNVGDISDVFIMFQ